MMLKFLSQTFKSLSQFNNKYLTCFHVTTHNQINNMEWNNTFYKGYLHVLKIRDHSNQFFLILGNLISLDLALNWHRFYNLLN